MNKRLLIFIGIATVVYLVSFFIVGPALQTYVIEPNMPYLIVDPDKKIDTGCSYDYMTYYPVEVTGRDPKDGIILPVSKIPVEYAEFVHYPSSWNSWYNWYNPKNPFSQIVYWTLISLTIVAGIGIIVYLIILWRKGVLKKLADKINRDRE